MRTVGRLLAVVAAFQIAGCAPHDEWMASAVDLRPPAMISNAESAVAPSRSVLGKVKHRAETGDAEAQFTLALMYQHGVHVTADPDLARIWVEKAAAQGHARALERLAASESGAAARPVVAAPIDAEAGYPRPEVHIASDPPAERLEGRASGQTPVTPVPDWETEGRNGPPADPASYPAAVASGSEERQGSRDPRASDGEPSREPDREAVAAGSIPDRVPRPSITASGKEQDDEPRDQGADAVIADPSSEHPRASSAPETPGVKPSLEPEGAASAAARIPERAPKPPATSVMGLPIEGSDWVRARNERSWTVQVGGAGNREKLTRWLRDLSLPGQIAIFENPTRRSWYSAVYGSFPTRGEAERARRTLPEELQAHGPWTRSFREIQELLIDTPRGHRQ